MSRTALIGAKILFGLLIFVFIGILLYSGGIAKIYSSVYASPASHLAPNLCDANPATAARNIIEWERVNINNVIGKSDLCLKVASLDDVSWTYRSRCGACGEFSYLFTDLARACNLTVMTVNNPGEDHQWNAVLINGSWITVDSTQPNESHANYGYDVPDDFYENNSYAGAWAKNLSYVYGELPNGSRIDLTARYSTTGNVSVYINRDGALVYVISNSYVPRKPTGLKCTPINHYCNFNLGNTSYEFIAVGPGWLDYDSVLVNVTTNSATNITLAPTFRPLERWGALAQTIG
ncbi:hypothetical protein AUJ14_02685 [Candidatus Micrarchaeota archaeon CG1_02_55_22]|nr:MAG: hypothetical protein AUJ14_02685 [Candidatus Micrarchaeota archaeon CG1_02_55_22]